MKRTWSKSAPARNLACRCSGFALVIGFDSARALQDGAQRVAGNFAGLGVPRRRPMQRKELPELAFRKLAVDNDELAIEPLGSAVGRTPEPAAIAGATRAYGHLQGARWCSPE